MGYALKEDKAKYDLDWRSKNKERVRAYNLKQRGVLRRHTLKKLYGMTPEQYDEMLKSQDGRCAICGADKPGGKRKFFCIDHDHQTGTIRGLLCHRCNVGIGALQDSFVIVARAAEYLSGKVALSR